MSSREWSGSALDRQVAWLFRINAVINCALAIRGIVDPAGMVAAFGGPPPTYPFLVRLWSGLVFMFGVMFWDIGTDIRGKASFVKYNWIEKLITASAVTLGFCLRRRSRAADAPDRVHELAVDTLHRLRRPQVAARAAGPSCHCGTRSQRAMTQCRCFKPIQSHRMISGRRGWAVVAGPA